MPSAAPLLATAQPACYYSRGFILPALHVASASPAPSSEIAPAPEVPAMPEGYLLEDRPDGLHLVRICDGEQLGIMSSPGLAARHAAVLQRMEAMRR